MAFLARRFPLCQIEAGEGEQAVSGLFQAIGDSAALQPPFARDKALRRVSTSAAVFADFGALQPELRFRVYQLSEEVGPGFALDRVVTIDGNRPVPVAAPRILKEL